MAKLLMKKEKKTVNGVKAIVKAQVFYCGCSIFITKICLSLSWLWLFPLMFTDYTDVEHG